MKASPAVCHIYAKQNTIYVTDSDSECDEPNNLLQDDNRKRNYSWKENVINWCRSDIKSFELLQQLAIEIKKDFTSYKEWQDNIDIIFEYMLQVLPNEDQELWNECNNFKSQRNQSPEQKAKMKRKKNIQNKIYRWLNVLEKEIKYKDYGETNRLIIQENRASRDNQIKAQLKFYTKMLKDSFNEILKQNPNIDFSKIEMVHNPFIIETTTPPATPPPVDKLFVKDENRQELLWQDFLQFQKDNEINSDFSTNITVKTEVEADLLDNLTI